MKEESSFREKLSQVLNNKLSCKVVVQEGAFVGSSKIGCQISGIEEAHKAIIDLVKSVVPDKKEINWGFEAEQYNKNVGWNECLKAILTKIKL